MKATIPKLMWVRSGYLPNMFSWLSQSDGTRPAIWARPTVKGWYCQFAHFHYSQGGTGTTRDKAAQELMRNWHKIKNGRD